MAVTLAANVFSRLNHYLHWAHIDNYLESNVLGSHGLEFLHQKKKKKVPTIENSYAIEIRKGHFSMISKDPDYLLALQKGQNTETLTRAYLSTKR